jgi:hypothetical protein
VASFLTESIDLGAGNRRFFVNADGLGKDAVLTVELLDHLMKPLAGFSGDDAAKVATNGFQTPVEFAGKAEVGGLPERVKVRVTFEGKKRTGIRFSAMYVR